MYQCICYVCEFVCTSLYMYGVCVFVKCMCVYVCMCVISVMCVCIFVCASVCDLYESVYQCMWYVYECVCICLCMCMCVCMYN